MEGLGLHPGRAQGAQPGAHLTGGAGGERDREHLLRHHQTPLHQVRDAVGDRSRLAGARTSEDADRSARCHDRLPLLRIQPFQESRLLGHAGIFADRPRRTAVHPGLDPRVAPAARPAAARAVAQPRSIR